MYVIYPADDLISLLITREYTQRRNRSGISPVVPQTPPASNRPVSPLDPNGNRPQLRNQLFSSNFNSNLNNSPSPSFLDNQEFQFDTPAHQRLSDIFSEQLRDQHNRTHHYDSRETSLERSVAAELQKSTQLPSNAGARAVGAALFPPSADNNPSNQSQLRARSSTPAPGERSVSASGEGRVPLPFQKEGSTETTESNSKPNKPKRSVSFHTFDRKQSVSSQTKQTGPFVNGQPPSVKTSRLNLNRRVSPAPDLVETRQGFGSSTNINSSTSNTSSNPSGSKGSSLLKKGKSWLPRITFSIQEEREEHPPSGAAAAAPKPSSSSSSSREHHSHHHQQQQPQQQQPHHHHHHHHHPTGSSTPSSAGIPSNPAEPADSFADFLGKSYRGAANSSSASKLSIQGQGVGPISSKQARGVSPATASSATPTSSHQRFGFLSNNKGGGGSSGGGGNYSGGANSGGASSSMAGVNGGVSAIGSMLSLGASHHGQHLIAGQLVDANSLKDCVHPSLNESLKTHNSLSFKVIRIVSDFTQQLSQLHEQHAVQLQMLIENYRKRNAELRKERPPCNSAMFQIWEGLLQEVELDSQAHSDISASLARQVARPLLEKTFCLKIQSRKVFAHRESFETVLSKTEALLAKAYRDYCEACMQHIQMVSNQSLAQYYEAHNAYIQQLRGTNSMLREYHAETLPALLQELEDVYVDLCKELSDSVMLGSEIIATGSPETNRRYEQLAAICRNINGIQDLREFVKTMVVPVQATPRHAFTLPLPLLSVQEGAGDYANQDLSHVPVLKDELIMDRLITNSIRGRIEGLRKEMAELEAEMKPIQDSLDTLQRMQQRSLDSNLFNKANELQEEISMKRFDLRVAQMQVAALRAQRELFGPLAKSDTPGSGGGKGGKLDRMGGFGGDTMSLAGEDLSTGSGGSGGKGIDRKLSAATAQTMKSKWLKAFKSLKTTPAPGAVKEAEKKNTKEKDNKEPFQIFENHIFQEYTYKKITPCDICSQILRGHTRQGLRCRMCKMNVHPDCQEKVDKCQPKTRLLRRQRSTSELETKLTQISDTQQEGGGEDSGGGNNAMATAAGGGGGGAPPIPPNSVATTSTSKGNSSGNKGMDEFDQTYQVLKEANVLKKPGSGGGSSGGSGGSGNALHGSSQTLHSQHEVIPSTRIGRSNPSVNIIPGGTGSSGHNTPAGPGHHHSMSVAAAPSSGIRGPLGTERRDSFLVRKSMSADAGGPTNPAALVFNPRSISLTASPMPHSPRRRKLDLRMKSFSLDSPESTEHAQRRRYAHGSHSTSHSQSAWSSKYGVPYANGRDGFMMMMPSSSSGGALGNGMIHSNSSAFSAHASPSSDFYSQNQSPYASINHFAPSSPVHNRRTLLSTRNMRMSSVELPDENDKSHSSASTSPCPSPQKPHRLLPTNLYVVLYNFKARHPDELDLKAGYKITVIDTSDPDWWKGKCLGRIGYFPSKYVTKLHPGEKPLQVTHNLQVTDGADNGLKLLRDQIVIQIGEELDGMVTIRNGENKTGVCPRKYLQEV